MISKSKLSLYLKEKQNVLLIGRHGVGKTAIIREVFEAEGLNWKYFSAPTMDPWVDFIGVPKATIAEDGLEVLKLVKPEAFARDTIEALFFDEFNRASKKIKDAVMELIQFKSINGQKFKNLKVVWASINPHDDEGTYDVEKMDPALQDRFHIIINVPYEVDSGYLISKHGEIAEPFIKWWKALPEKIKFEVSPRRLDYAITIHTVGGELSDVLPDISNITRLKELISEVRLKPVEKLLDASDDEIKKYFTVSNTKTWMNDIVNNKKYHKFVEHFHKEIIEQEIQKKNKKLIAIVKNNDLVKQSISKKSQEILEENKSLQYLAASDQIRQSIEEAILSVEHGDYHECSKQLRNAFDEHIIEVNIKNDDSTEGFFGSLFGAQNAKFVEKYITFLASNCQGNKIHGLKNGFIPTVPQQVVSGMILLYAMQWYKQQNNLEICNLLNGSIQAINGYNKKDIRSDYKTPGLIYGLNEKYNKQLNKEIIEKKKIGLVTQTKGYRQFIKDFETGQLSWIIPNEKIKNV